MTVSLSTAVGRVKEAVEYVLTPQRPEPLPQIKRWEAAEITADTVEEVDAAIATLEAERDSQIKAWNDDLPRRRMMLVDAFIAARDQHEKNTAAIWNACHELRNHRKRLENLAKPVKRFRIEHPGATTADAVAALAESRTPELDTAIVRFAAAYLSLIEASGSLASLLAGIERELGVSLAGNGHQVLPVPAWIDLASSPLHRLPRPAENSAATATLLANLAQRWPRVADELLALHEQHVERGSMTADAPPRR
jgi:hypothetical protein